MTFLPKDYKAPSSGGKYMKLQKGENRFRILSSPILGFVAWKDRKPVRKPMGSKFDMEGLEQEPKHFWAFKVWNRVDEAVQILEITQITIQKAIEALSKDEDWGDPHGYDLKITRTGDGMETEYQVTPCPSKELEKEIKDAYEKSDIDLKALFDGGDPFGDKEQPGFKEESDLPF